VCSYLNKWDNVHNSKMFCNITLKRTAWMHINITNEDHDKCTYNRYKENYQATAYYVGAAL